MQAILLGTTIAESVRTVHELQLAPHLSSDTTNVFVHQ
jgi:hypothetical protein